MSTDFFGSGMLFFLLIMMFILNLYVSYTYYTDLTHRVNIQLSQVWNTIHLMNQDPPAESYNKLNCSDIKEICIPSDKIGNMYYPLSPSSLIEVSSDEGNSEENDYEDSDTDDTDDTDDDDNDDTNNEVNDYSGNSSNIKNVHMTLDLDELELNKFENIHVLLLDNNSPIQEEIIALESPSPIQEIVPEQSTNITELLTTKKKSTTDSDLKKMNLTDLRKYAIDNKMNIEVSKMKKTELLKAMDEYKNKQEKEKEREKEREKEKEKEREQNQSTFENIKEIEEK